MSHFYNFQLLFVIIYISQSLETANKELYNNLKEKFFITKRTISQPSSFLLSGNTKQYICVAKEERGTLSFIIRFYILNY